MYCNYLRPCFACSVEFFFSLLFSGVLAGLLFVLFLRLEKLSPVVPCFEVDVLLAVVVAGLEPVAGLSLFCIAALCSENEL